MKKDKLRRLETDLVCIDDVIEFLLKANPKPLEPESKLKMSLENIQDKVWYWRAMVWAELKELHPN